MVESWSAEMKKYFNNPNGSFVKKIDNNVYKINFADKYNDTIYFISPYYQRIFPTLNKLIVMDTDLEFRVDPAELFGEFDKFSVDNILGCVVIEFIKVLIKDFAQLKLFHKARLLLICKDILLLS